MDYNGVNDMFNTVFTSCNGAVIHAITKWPYYLIRCDKNNIHRQMLVCWYFKQRTAATRLVKQRKPSTTTKGANSNSALSDDSHLLKFLSLAHRNKIEQEWMLMLASSQMCHFL
jgi:hypothetical protein